MNKIEFDMACYTQAIPYLEDGPIKRFLIQMTINHYLNFDEEYRLMERTAQKFSEYKTGMMGTVTVTTPAIYFEEHKQEIVDFLKKMEDKE